MCPIFTDNLTKQQLIHFLEQYDSSELSITQEYFLGEIHFIVKGKLNFPPATLDDTL